MRLIRADLAPDKPLGFPKAKDRPVVIRYADLRIDLVCLGGEHTLGIFLVVRIALQNKIGHTGTVCPPRFPIWTWLLNGLRRSRPRGRICSKT